MHRYNDKENDKLSNKGKYMNLRVITEIFIIFAVAYFSIVFLFYFLILQMLIQDLKSDGSYHYW